PRLSPPADDALREGGGEGHEEARRERRSAPARRHARRRARACAGRARGRSDRSAADGEGRDAMMRSSRRDAARFFGMPRDNFDWTLFLTASALAVVGVVNLYSATSVSKAALSDIYIQQVYWLV